MSCTHDCGCTPEIRDARTDEWVQIGPQIHESDTPQEEPMTDDRDARHARLLAQVPEEGCWAVCTWLNGDEHALHVTPSGHWLKASSYRTSWGNDEARIVSLLDPRPDWQPLPDGPTEAHIGRRVRLIKAHGLEAVGIVTGVEDRHHVQVSNCLFGVGTGDWYVDANDTSPDAAAIEAIITAYRRSPECSTDAVFGEAILDHLRAQGFDVTPRAEQ